MLDRVLRGCAWLCLACIVFFTLGPVGFRPRLIAGEANLDRFAAYFVLAVLFAWAYPHRLLSMGCLVLLSAISLEALQLLTPDRHGHIEDLVIKLLGAAVGLQLGMLTVKFRAARIERRPTDSG